VPAASAKYFAEQHFDNDFMKPNILSVVKIGWQPYLLGGDRGYEAIQAN
jgi:hypothetical protein